MILLFCLLTWFAFPSLTAGAEPDDANICMTRNCLETLKFFKSTMDMTVDPCDDFHQFICGKALEAQSKEKAGSMKRKLTSKFGRASITIEMQLEKMLREFVEAGDSVDNPNKLRLAKFYEGCMNTRVRETRGLEPLIDIIKGAGGCPIFGQKFGWSEQEQFDWIKMTRYFRSKGLDHSMMVNVVVGPNPLKDSKMMIWVTGPQNLGRTMAGRSTTELLLYYGMLLSHLIKINDAGLFDRMSMMTRMLKVRDFRQQIYDEGVIASSNAKERSVKDLKNDLPNIDWERLLESIIGHPIDDLTTVVLLDLKYLKNLNNILDKSAPGVIADHMIITMIEKTFGLLNNAWKIIPLEKEQWRDCVGQVQKKLGLAISAEYVKRTLVQSTRTKAEDMVSRIKNELRNMIDEAEWISDSSKHMADIKLNAMREFVGYPDELLDDNLIEDLHKNMEDFNVDDHFGNVLKVDKYETDMDISLLDRRLFDDIWMMHSHSTETNAFYVPMANSIHILASMLQNQFFQNYRPNYVNYGSLGSIVGHEITHGFDPDGARYDHLGNKNSWWDKETEEGFVNKASCFVKQYDGLPIPEAPKTKLNGSKTIGENMADNGGYQLAFRSYKRWQEANEPEPKIPGMDFTSDQMFWISAGTNWCMSNTKEVAEIMAKLDVHSPAKLRVNVPLGNLKEFSDSFSCPVGSPMNPEHKCTLI